MRSEVVKVQAVTEQSFCPSCGSSVDGMRFCTNCGTPVSAAPASPIGAAPEPVTGPQARPASTPTPARGTRLVPPATAPFAGPAPRSAYEQAAGEPPAYQPPLPPQKAAQRSNRGPGRNNVVLWVMVAILVVLLVGGGAFALGSLAGKSDEGTAVQTPVSAPTGSPAPSSGSSRSAAPKRSKPRKTDAGAKVARSLSTLISDSAKAKTAVSAAVGYLDSCRHVPASIRTLDNASRSRSDLVTRARRLDTSGAPATGTVVSQLVSAWQKSAKADSAFADYGRSLHHIRKGKCVGHQAWRNRGVRLSAQSHPAKQAAARAWNKLAHRYGLATIAWGEL